LPEKAYPDANPLEMSDVDRRKDADGRWEPES
jgi:hypothetical protein